MYEFCSKLAATGKSGMVYVISVSRCSHNLNLGNSFLLKKQLLKLRTLFKSSYSDATEIWSNLCAIKHAFRTNEDALTETFLNFRNVLVVLDEDNTTIGAKQPKSYKHSSVKFRKETNSWTISHLIVFYFHIKTKIC